LLTFWYINHKRIKGKEFIYVTIIYKPLPCSDASWNEHYDDEQQDCKRFTIGWA